MDRFNFDYSLYSDILHLHKASETTKGSVELGDFTLDFGDKDDVVGIEIEHASEFFINVDIDKKSLTSLKSAEFIIDSKNPQVQVIYLKLEFPKVIRKIPVPMLLFHNAQVMHSTP